MSKHLFENITDDEYKTLEEILHNPNSTPITFYYNDPTIDGRIKELDKAKLINIDGNGKLNISELGRAALVEHDKIVKQRKFIETQRREELTSLKAIADSAIKQAQSAESIAQAAKEQANSAKSIADSSISQANAAVRQADSAESIAKSSAQQSETAMNQAESAKAIADSSMKTSESAKSIAKTAEESSESSTKYAKISAVLSIIAIIISIAAIALPLLCG